MEVSKGFAQRNNYNSKLYNRMAKSIFHKPDKLEESNMKLKKSYSQLNLIKDNIIKDMIYSHKNVPFCWKNKINYRQKVMNLIAKGNGDIMNFDVSFGSLSNQILRATRLKYVLEQRINKKEDNYL